MAKLTLQLSPEMERVLDNLASSRQLPKAQVLRRAMLLMQFLDDQVADDHDIVIKDNQTGELSRLVFESQMTERRRSDSPTPETQSDQDRHKSSAPEGDGSGTRTPTGDGVVSPDRGRETRNRREDPDMMTSGRATPAGQGRRKSA